MMHVRKKSTYPVMLFILVFSLFSFLGCFKKRNTTPSNIQEWLDAHWTGRFEVLSTPTNFTDKDYYFNKRESVVAETADREVQFIMRWIKGEKELGLTEEMVEEALEKSRHDATRARQIGAQLKTAGLENVSVGSARGTASVFIFAEPSPDAREKDARRVLDVMQSIPVNDRPDFEMSFMEANQYGTEFNEIVPAGHWARRDTWHHRNEIMRLSIPADGTADLKTLSKQWQFNTLSDRLLEYIKRAYPEAVQWAVKNIRKPVTVEAEQMVEYSLDEHDGLLINIGFPFFENGADTESAAAGGLISGDYHVDKGTFTRLHMTKYEVDQE